MSDVVALTNRDFATVWTQAKASCLITASAITAVTNDQQLEEAGAVQTVISKLIKKLETERKLVTSPLDDAKKQIMAEEKKLAKPLQDELARLKVLTSAYATECARRIEEERRAAELAERRAAEAALAAEEEDPYGFNTPATTPVTPLPTFISSMPTTTSNRMVEKWGFEVIDANAVPKELCSPDERKIRAVLASRKAEGYKADQVVINGLRIFSTVQVQSR